MAIWKDIKGYKGFYKASSSGFIKNRYGKILKHRINKSGYARCVLYKKKHKNPQLYHRVIAKTFIANTENKPQINHKNGNKLDNSVKNLEWCTISENAKHAFATGLRVVHNKYKLNEFRASRIRLMKEVSPRLKLREMGKMFGVAPETIHRVLKKRSWIRLF